VDNPNPYPAGEDPAVEALAGVAFDWVGCWSGGTIPKHVGPQAARAILAAIRAGKVPGVYTRGDCTCSDRISPSDPTDDNSISQCDLKAMAADAQLNAATDEIAALREKLDESERRRDLNLAAASRWAGSRDKALAELAEERAMALRQAQLFQQGEHRLRAELAATTEWAENLSNARIRLMDRAAYVERGLQQRETELADARAEVGRLAGLLQIVQQEAMSNHYLITGKTYDAIAALARYEGPK
jgi:hypothetical protein